ncbi:cupin domain-containing protein [Sanguibacter suaedae]|uniref:Cupin domain-containing protein n=1 Tax=Sanguibacter suaedae TaxID=2795737 RepID=A0A934I8C9_9MICO|nr:cupin domain-containing protein [Sanguibacter suaedae]MBI9113857.1 cupin domain-containing protein [Sanguibacter suaedae]
MEKFSLTAIARQTLETARATSNGRTAQTVFGGHEHVLRQTIIAMTAGTRLDEHENPGEATVIVLEGRVVLTAGENSWEGARGSLIAVPQARHAVEALEDSAILLTVAKLR